MENKTIPGSSSTVVLLLTQAAILGFSTSILYTSANSLFLARHGADTVPLAYLATAILVPPVFALLLTMQKRLSIQVFCLAPLLVFAGLMVIAPVLYAWKNPAWLSFGLMVSFVLLMQTNMVVLGTRANQLWDVQEMKRLYPLVLAGQVAGVITGGGMVGSLSQLLGGTPRLLYAVAAGLGGAALLGLGLPSGAHHPEKRRPTPGSRSLKRGVSLLGSTHVRHLLAYRISLELGSNLVNFLFLREVGSHSAGTESVTTFLGGFMAAATLMTLLFLVFATGRLLLRFGVGLGLAANPMVTGCILCGAVCSAFLAGTDTRAFYFLVLAARLANFVLVTGLADPALKAAYQPLDQRRREAVQMVVEGVGVPMAVGLAGIILLTVSAVPGIGSGHIGLLTLLVMVLVLMFSQSAFRSYRLTLERTLAGLHSASERIRLDDKSSLAAVVDLLGSSDGRHVRLALDILEQDGKDSYREQLPALLDHPDADIRRDAILRIESEGIVAAIPAIRRILETEEDPGVKASALRAVCTLDQLSGEEIVSWIHDGRTEIRMAALAGLIRSNGVDGALLGRHELVRLLESDKFEDRLFLAQLVGKTGSVDFCLPLYDLLADPDPRVRRAALAAAVELAPMNFSQKDGKVSDLLKAVLACMEDRLVRAEAGTALVAFGNKILPLVSAALDTDSIIPKDTGLRLIRVCGRLEPQDVVPELAGYLGHPDPDFRSELARTLSVLGYAARPVDKADLRRTVLAELGRAEMLHAALPALRTAGAEVLASAMAEELAAASRRLCIQLGFLYGKAGFSQLYQRLHSGDSKEHGLARELLELSLDRELAKRVITLLDTHEAVLPSQYASSISSMDRGSDGVGPAGRTPAGRTPAGRTPASRTPAGRTPAGMGLAGTCSDMMAEILADADSWFTPWIKVCAVYEAARLKHAHLVPQIYRLQKSGEAMLVRAARQALQVLEGNENGGSKMVDVQRVILFKSSPIFEETPSRSLAALAGLAETVELPAGETIIRKGELENSLYVIFQGRMRVHDGDHIIAFLEAGEIIGEMALLDPAPRAASVSAVEDSVLLRIDKEAFDLALADNPEIAHGVFRVLCRRLRTQIQRQD